RCIPNRTPFSEIQNGYKTRFFARVFENLNLIQLAKTPNNYNEIYYFANLTKGQETTHEHKFVEHKKLEKRSI
ncbi:7235_t:CDS:2, partial [Gigaspora margarita]